MTNGLPYLDCPHERPLCPLGSIRHPHTCLAFNGLLQLSEVVIFIAPTDTPLGAAVLSGNRLFEDRRALKGGQREPVRIDGTERGRGDEQKKDAYPGSERPLCPQAAYKQRSPREHA
jgi:hypothetical protein